MFMFGSKDDGAYAGIRNTNVKLAFLYRWTFSVTQGLWNLGIGSTYIYMMEGSSNTVCPTLEHRLAVCSSHC